MEYLWSPWRYPYVAQEVPQPGCIFCLKVKENQDEENLVLCRGLNNYVLLNLYPYTSGHLMIAPYAHVGQLSETDDATWTEMMELTRKAVWAIEKAYRPEGINLGMNLGKSAGAGIPEHLHMHVLPRWYADSNFLSTIGQTRVLPEALTDTYRKLKPLF